MVRIFICYMCFWYFHVYLLGEDFVDCAQVFWLLEETLFTERLFVWGACIVLMIVLPTCLFEKEREKRKKKRKTKNSCIVLMIVLPVGLSLIRKRKKNKEKSEEKRKKNKSCMIMWLPFLFHKSFYLQVQKKYTDGLVTPW